MDRITFKSIKKDNIRYVFVESSTKENNSGFYNHPSAFVASTAFQFDTMGDGEIRHTPLYLVGAEEIEDFTCSLALYLSENHSMDAYNVLHYNLLRIKDYNQGNQRKEIQFLYGLKNPQKETWINLSDCKKSYSESKDHDKRWIKLSCDFLPNFENIYPFFIASFHGLLDRLFLTEHIREATDWNIWVDYEEYFKIKDFNNIRNALNIIEAFIVAYDKLAFIARAGENIKHNVKIKED
ncbi:MAG: hypothetical protein KJ604_20320 [Gammaproteobacteria bacterium]|nr:hypothetical protein [Gammaproteobacteria bacterium]